MWVKLDGCHLHDTKAKKVGAAAERSGAQGCGCREAESGEWVLVAGRNVGVQRQQEVGTLQHGQGGACSHGVGQRLWRLAVSLTVLLTLSARTFCSPAPPNPVSWLRRSAITTSAYR